MLSGGLKYVAAFKAKSMRIVKCSMRVKDHDEKVFWDFERKRVLLYIFEFHVKIVGLIKYYFKIASERNKYCYYV